MSIVSPCSTVIVAQYFQRRRPAMLLPLSEQHETTATLNYCVVFKVYSGLPVYSRWADSGRDVDVRAIAKDPDRRRPVT